MNPDDRELIMLLREIAGHLEEISISVGLINEQGLLVKTEEESNPN